jgi:cold-inducible RNA-binding protein
VGTRIYVGNLPYTADTALVSDLLRPYGDLVEAHLITDRVTGEFKGYAFVELDTEESARRAIAALNGTVVGDRTLRLEVAGERPTGGRARQSGGARSTDARSSGLYSDHSDRPRRDGGAHGSDR